MKYKIYMFYKCIFACGHSRRHLIRRALCGDTCSKRSHSDCSSQLCVRMHVAKDHIVIALQISPLCAGLAISQYRGATQKLECTGDINPHAQSF